MPRSAASVQASRVANKHAMLGSLVDSSNPSVTLWTGRRPLLGTRKFATLSLAYLTSTEQGQNIGPRRDIVQSCSIFHININENNQNLLWPSVIILIHNLTTNMNQPNIWNKKLVTCYSSWNQQWNKHVSSKYQTSGHQQFMRFHKGQNTLQKRALINEAFMSHCYLNQTLNLHISYTYVVYESHRHIYTICRCTRCKHLRNIIPDGSTPVRWDLSG